MSLTPRQRKKLWAVSGNECAFPECNQELVDKDLDVVYGEMAHIKGKNDGSARHDSDMDPEKRESPANRILLCSNHHSLIDDAPGQYPPNKLHKMKKEHESKSYETPDIPIETINKMVNSADLLVHLNRQDLTCLSNILDWKPKQTFPRKESNGERPILVDYGDIKELQLKLKTLTQMMEHNKNNKNSGMPKMDDILRATSTAAKLTNSAIQYYQVETERKLSKHDGF